MCTSNNSHPNYLPILNVYLKLCKYNRGSQPKTPTESRRLDVHYIDFNAVTHNLSSIVSMAIMLYRAPVDNSPATEGSPCLNINIIIFIITCYSWHSVVFIINTFTVKLSNVI